MTDDLLVKYLLGEATAAEQEDVQEWIGASPDNHRYFEHFRLIWEKSAQIVKTSIVDEDEAWKRFQARVESGDKGRPALKESTRIIPLGRQAWVRAAAVLLLVVCGSMLTYYLAGPGRRSTLEAGNAIVTDTLPDGSVVTLNRNATLSYPRSFNGAAREVQLEGEAFFNITPDRQKPFIITANDVKVRVVGTSFNVKSSREKTEVIVETGIVEVSKKKKAITVTPRETAIVLRSNPEPLKQHTIDELYNYYRTRKFVCNRTPLWRLVDVLNEAYDSHIVIGDKNLQSLPITVTFDNEPLDKVLMIVSSTHNFRVQKTDKQIILTNAGQ